MFYTVDSSGITLRVRLTPNSSCCKIMGTYTAADGLDYLKINVISPPEKGKANAELLKFLAKTFHIAKTNLTIVYGELDRYKKILITSTSLLDNKDLDKLIEKEQI